MDRLEPISKPALVVEDEARVRTLFCEFLGELGYQPEAVADGFDAMERLLSAHYELVILDANLPGMHGLDLLREMQASMRIVPVLMVSGYHGLKRHNLVNSYPIIRFLPKPIDMAALKSEVEKLCLRNPSRSLRSYQSP